MTQISMEVLDNEDIDCGYYGSAFVVRRVTLEKQNGDISSLKHELTQKLTDIVNKHKLSSQLTSQIAKKRNELHEIKQSIRTAKQKVTMARRAVSALDKTFDVSQLNDDNIATQTATANILNNEIDHLQASLDEQLRQEREAKSDDARFKNIVDEVCQANELKRKHVTLTDIFNSTVGSTYLYNRLLSDGWVVKTDDNTSINHITLGGNGIDTSELIEYRDHGFEVSPYH